MKYIQFAKFWGIVSLLILSGEVIYHLRFSNDPDDISGTIFHKLYHGALNGVAYAVLAGVAILFLAAWFSRDI
jgi:hypothetical protein